MITVALVDDHRIVRTGIRRLLDDASHLSVVGEASSGEDAIELVRQHSPDVVLMDVHMPGIGGLEATRKLLRLKPELAIIALTVYVCEPYPTSLMGAGALGYLTKGCDEAEIRTAIESVHRGQRFVSADIAREMALSGLNGEVSNGPFDKLSQREVQVMLMVTQGHSKQDISDTLCLSPKTVSTYTTRLQEKLGVSNDVELTRLAIRYGFVDEAI